MSYQDASLIFNFPTKSRPERFQIALQSILQNIKRKDKISFSVTLDNNCTRLHEYTAICKDNNIVYQLVNSKNKIDAFNKFIYANWFNDIIISTSDDMVFTHYGFDEVIRKDMSEQFDARGGLLHYNDGFQRSNVCTLSIVSGDYYCQDGYIYHPDYESVWCDVEATDVAKARNQYRYMGDDIQLFKHVHPSWGIIPYDQQYLITENSELNEKDKQTYLKRKEHGFPSTSIYTDTYITWS